MCLAAQSCLILCDPKDWGPTGSSVHGDSPGKNTRVSCHALLQGIFPTQGSNPGLPHCRQILYHLSHQGNPGSIYLNKTIIQKDTCTPMFRAALFTIAKTWKKPKCPLRDEWIKKMWYIHTMDYYSAIKGRKSCLCNHMDRA